jgi:DNA-binding NarL/FixJ family response regulator
VARARELLERALSLYDELEMVTFAARTRDLLNEPPLGDEREVPGAVPHASRYPDGLSQREVEVLRLIALGKGNKEIADWLVISRNTVIRHVNNILAKTGCANRTAAAAYTHRRGLIE